MVERWQNVDVVMGELPPSPDKVREVVKELDPKKNPRYTPENGKTWCNIFLTDVVRAMGHLPHHWMKADGSGPGKPPSDVEMSANKLVAWFDKFGPAHGWIESDRQSAFAAAERGHLVVLGWFNDKPGSGHVAVLLPEGTIAQAGRRNFVGEPVSAGFGTLPVRYFVQMNSGPHKHSP